MEIVCRDITFRYQKDRSPIFSHLKARLELTGFNAVFGLSGSGKSTLAKLISGLEPPQSGSIELAAAGQRALLLYSWNGERIPCWQRIIDHFHSVTPEKSYGLLDELTDQFGLTDLMLSRFSRLSMGQKNRVNLVRYLVQDSDLLILDEVLANVDEPMRHHILGFIKQRFPEKNILYIAHSAAEVAAYAKRIFILPQASEGGTSRLMETSGLDLSALDGEGGRAAGPEDRALQAELRQKSMEILALASSPALFHGQGENHGSSEAREGFIG